MEVDIPVSCKIAGMKKPWNGRIQDLSISGLRVHLAVPFSKLKAKIMDFVLELPAPFSVIRGSGRVQWKRWDADAGRTECGLELEPMSLKHLSDLDAIVSELDVQDRGAEENASTAL